MLRRIIIPWEAIVEEESEDTDDTDTVSSHSSRKEWSRSPSAGISDIPPPSPVRTRYGKARKEKERELPYKGYKGVGVVYLPGDINGLARKLQLLAAEFFAGNTTVRNEFVHVLDALL